MGFLVYKLTNTVNGKVYVGITARTLSDRWREHCERARQGKRGSRLHQAMRKYGAEAFLREIIATAETEDDVRQLERDHILALDTMASGYNCNEGGSGFLKFPDHIKRKISEAQKGKIISDATKAKMSAAKRGDSRCAVHFGNHTKKGAENPRARRFVIGCPDNFIRVITGLRAFAREHGLHLAHLNQRGHSKGYAILDRLNHPVTRSAAPT